MPDELDGILDFIKAEKVKVAYREDQKTKLALSIEDKRRGSTTLLQVVELFKKLGGENETELLSRLDKFISFGLSFVFEEDLSFVSHLNIEGKDVKLEFLVKKKDHLVAVENAYGGGLLEVVSILMQVFFIIMGRGVFAPFLLLDTALVNLSDAYVMKMSSLLRDICYGTKIQIILTSHTSQFSSAADMCYVFSQEDGKTIAERKK